MREYKGDRMGMNRKWNMKVFELHENDGGNTPVGHVDPIPPVNPTDEVHTDTTTREITMIKAPFDFSEAKEQEGTVSINIDTLTPDSSFAENFFDASKWKFIEGSERLLSADTENNEMTFSSRVKAVFDMPTEAKRWVFTCDYHSDPNSFRTYLGFDGVADTDTTMRYAYGMDIPRTGNPHLDKIMRDPETENGIVEATVADEMFFTGQDYMKVIITRWDDTYTICYDNRYMITIPTEDDSVNRLGIWSWSGSWTKIKDPQLCIIDDDTEASGIIIEGLAPHQTLEPTTPGVPKVT